MPYGVDSMKRNNLMPLPVVCFTGIMSAVLSLSCGGNAKPPVTLGPEKAPAVAATSPTKNESRPKGSANAPKPKVPGPTILSRKEWNAKDPRGEGKVHDINCITIHHTAVAQNLKLPIEKKLQNLQRFSQNEERLASGKMKPAWIDVPYHFYIAVDGKIAEGRPIKFASDTNTEYDPTQHATIVVEGNFENEQPSAEQQASLQAMVAWLSVKYDVPVARIKAHNDYAKTACPGVNLKKLLPELRDKVAEQTAAAGER